MSSIAELPYRFEHSLVVTNPTNIFNFQLGSDNHISTLPREKTFDNCLFCCKKSPSVQNFKNHLKVETDFKTLSNFSA